jgi:hypothetical protein
VIDAGLNNTPEEIQFGRVELCVESKALVGWSLGHARQLYDLAS